MPTGVNRKLSRGPSPASRGTPLSVPRGTDTPCSPRSWIRRWAAAAQSAASRFSFPASAVSNETCPSLDAWALSSSPVDALPSTSKMASFMARAAALSTRADASPSSTGRRLAFTYQRAPAAANSTSSSPASAFRFRLCIPFPPPTAYAREAKKEGI